jgi:hypothetical protein
MLDTALSSVHTTYMPNVTMALNIRIPPELRVKLEKVAKDNDWTLNQAAVMALIAGFDTIMVGAK